MPLSEIPTCILVGNCSNGVLASHREFSRGAKLCY